MKYKIFLGKVQPSGPREHLSVFFLRSHVVPPISKWIDAPDWNWNLRSSCALTSTVMFWVSRASVNIFTSRCNVIMNVNQNTLTLFDTF